MKTTPLIMLCVLSVCSMLSSCQSPDGWYLATDSNAIGLSTKTLIASVADIETLSLDSPGNGLAVITGSMKADKQQMCVDALENSENRTMSFMYNGELNSLEPSLYVIGFSKNSFSLFFRDISEQQIAEIFATIKKGMK